MATSAACRNLWVGDGLQTASQDVRLAVAGGLLSGLGASSSSGLLVGQGVRNGPGNPLGVSAAGGMNLSIAAGICAVQGTSATDQGAYLVVLDATPTLTVAASNPSLPRIDSVCVTVTDLGSSSSSAVVQIITGTPAASPSAPSLPANSLLLCNVAVGAGVSSITSGNLTDSRSYLAAAGGVQPVTSSSFYRSVAAPSDYAHNLATGRLLSYRNGSTPTYPLVAPWAPSVVTVTSNVDTSSNTTASTVASTSITVDGNTKVKAEMSWGSMTMPTAGVTGSAVLHQLLIDGTQVDQWYVQWYQGVPTGGRGGCGMHVYPSTPAAGTHTYTWQIICAMSGQTWRLNAGTTTPAQFIVSPMLG